MAYLRGRREFYGRDFVVTPAVLVPRPETETLVERALAILPTDAVARVLDLCTGSGCIGLTLLAERPMLRAMLTDLSGDAIAIATQNAEKLGVAERAELRVGDLFAPLEPGSVFDLVVANPPYLAPGERAELEPDVRDFEPAMALFAPDEGLAIVRRILADAAAWMAPGARLQMENGPPQVALARGAFESPGFSADEVHRDLGGRDRVVEGQRPG
jgi:release factor glutamine methyltransferase